MDIKAKLIGFILLIYVSALMEGSQAQNSQLTTVNKPIAAFVEPAVGTGVNQRFTFIFADSSGASNLSWVNIKFTPVSTRASCWIAYNVQSEILSLANDNSSAWATGKLAHPSPLQNSQCSLNLSHSAASVSGLQLTLALDITFLPSFKGMNVVYLRAQNKQGLDTDYAPKGVWDTAVSQTRDGFPAETGAHWVGNGQFESVKRLGYSFAVVTCPLRHKLERQVLLREAKNAGITLIVGATPSPYLLKPDGSWEISKDGIAFLKDLKAAGNVVKAVFVYNEPYWIYPDTSRSDPCGALSATQLRALRVKIRKAWPEVKIYQDIGDPASWTHGGVSWKPCVGNKYDDQSDVADYVGIWSYPFEKGRNNHEESLAVAYNASRYVLDYMKPAKPVFLAQSFACSRDCEQSMPTKDQLKDWNCSLRAVLAPGTLVSWYVWRQTMYSDYLKFHPDYWPFTTASACKSADTLP